MVAVNYNLVNIKIYKNKTYGLMREIQTFQLIPINDIKACFSLFKY